MILQLSKNITIEREENGKPIGDVIFKKADFSLFVDLTGFDILNDAFTLVFKIIRKSDNRVLDNVGLPITINPTGRDGMITNANEVADYNETKDKLKNDIKDMRKVVKDIQQEIKPLRDDVTDTRETITELKTELFNLEQIQNPTADELALIDAKKVEIQVKEDALVVAEGLLTDKQTELSLKSEELSVLELSLNELQEVLPIYEKIDKYADIVGAKIVNNKLTTEGLAWVKTLPLLKTTVGDCVV